MLGRANADVPTNRRSRTLVGLRRACTRTDLFVVVVGLAWSIVASATHPFSLGADLVTGFALGAFLIVAITNNLSPAASIGKPFFIALRKRPISAPRPATWTTIAWATLVGIIVAFELFNYLELPRSAHPTLSSFLAVVAAHQGSRGLAFFSWLVIGKRLAQP